VCNAPAAIPDPDPARLADLFGTPLRHHGSGGEMVPTNGGVIRRREDQAAPIPIGHIDEPDHAPADSAHAAERDRLLGLCQSLRAAHRCPGRCVLTGELRRGGLSAFRESLDGDRS
jgi:hypothetical protein